MIKLGIDTRKALQELRLAKRESYDEVLKRLIKYELKSREDSLHG